MINQLTRQFIQPSINSSNHSLPVSGNVDVLSEGFQYTSTSPSTIAIAFYNGLWSYDGWWVALAFTILYI